MSNQNLKLHEWIARGRQNGTIQDVSTVIWAYCLDEQHALNWVADIVTGQVHESDALASMKVTLCIDEVLGDLDWSQMNEQLDDKGDHNANRP